MVCLIILDDPREGEGGSIIDLKSVKYVDGKLQIASYLDDFPFSFYVVCQDINQLPEICSSALREWFSMLQQND